jgi:hypothetical protein
MRSEKPTEKRLTEHGFIQVSPFHPGKAFCPRENARFDPHSGGVIEDHITAKNSDAVHQSANDDRQHGPSDLSTLGKRQGQSAHKQEEAQ